MQTKKSKPTKCLLLPIVFFLFFVFFFRENKAWNFMRIICPAHNLLADNSHGMLSYFLWKIKIIRMSSARNWLKCVFKRMEEWFWVLLPFNNLAVIEQNISIMKRQNLVVLNHRNCIQYILRCPYTYLSQYVGKGKYCRRVSNYAPEALLSWIPSRTPTPYPITFLRKDGGTTNIISKYCIKHEYRERQAWANSEDPEQ